MPVGSSSEEQKFRNDNLRRVEEAKLKKGVGSLESEMAPMGLSELGDFFSLQKVK